MAGRNDISTLEHVGQITCADVTLGNVTVLVGPQATGKSIFLQFLKLVLDTGYVHDQLGKHGIDWKRAVKSAGSQAAGREASAKAVGMRDRSVHNPLTLRRGAQSGA